MNYNQRLAELEKIRCDSEKCGHKMKRLFLKQHKKYVKECSKGVCLETNCGGRIIRRAKYVSPRGCEYHTAECEKCKKKYPFIDSSKIPTIGETECLAAQERFHELLYTPYGL